MEFVPRGLKIRTCHIDDLRNVTTYLNASKVEYYTFDSPRDSIKYLIRGLPLSALQAEVHSALATHDIVPIALRQLQKTVYNPDTRSRDTSLLPLWLITISKSADVVARLKAITGLLHFRVRIEDYRGRTALQQCYRCQKFGHKATFCHMALRCAKCAQGHNTRDCPDPRPVIDSPKCANCNGDHQANFSECPELLKFQRAQRPRPRPPGLAPAPSAFPPLPPRPSAASLARPPPPPPAIPPESLAGLQDLASFLTSLDFRRYLSKCMDILRDYSRQTDGLGKFMTLCNGALELLQMAELPHA